MVPPLPQRLTPVELATIPEPNLPMIETPQIKVPPVPIAAAAAHPHRERKKPVVKAVVTPPSSAPADPDPQQQEAVSIGALSTGGDSSPQAKNEAVDMIASIEKRINGLSTQTAEEQKAQISKVRNFEKQAQDALSSGDVEGAKTLATKAKLLLDDLEK
jgi:ribosomal protein S20